MSVNKTLMYIFTLFQQNYVTRSDLSTLLLWFLHKFKNVLIVKYSPLLAWIKLIFFFKR
jgi:hypothetical protein